MQEAEQQAQAQGCSHLLVDTFSFRGAAVLSEIRLSAADVAARLPARRHAAPLFVEGAVTILGIPGRSGTAPVVVPDGGINALSGLHSPPVVSPHPRTGKRSAAGQDIRHGTCILAGWRLLPYPSSGVVRPVVDIPTCATETAGAGGLKIAETFPEGRGSPHGCGLRAVFCTDAASARPEACRDKSKGPRSGDFAGRSPGVQGAAATGRPCALPAP